MDAHLARPKRSVGSAGKEDMMTAWEKYPHREDQMVLTIVLLIQK